MRQLISFLLCLLFVGPAYAGPTKVKRDIPYLGGVLTEACTDGVCDGIVIWSNGTMQEVHNRKRGRWIPVVGTDEGPSLATDEEGDVPLAGDVIVGTTATITCPGGSVNVATNASIQAAVDANPGATTFCLATGVHYVTSAVTPKTGNTFVGTYGAILDGTNWATADTTQGAFRSWNQSISGVTIKNIVVRHMPQKGITATSGSGATGWSIENNEVWGSVREGIGIPTASSVLRNYIHNNTYGGYLGYLLADVTIDHNTITYNGAEQKIVGSARVSFTNNTVSNNTADGIWYDTDNTESVVTGNTVASNGRSGIHIEISGSTTISDNTVSNSGETGIFIVMSKSVTISNNTLTDNFRGIQYYLKCSIVGGGTMVGGYDLKDNTASGNTIYVPTTSGAWSSTLGWPAADGTCSASYLDGTKNLHYTANTYWVPVTATKYWMWGQVLYKSWAEWQALGHDTAGSMSLRTVTNSSTAIIDDYILISPKQVTAWGGMTASTNKAHVAVDLMNQSFINSGVNAQVHIVGVVKDTVEETTDFNTDLTEVHNRFVAGAFTTVRTANGFDIISKLVTNGQYCGLGYLYSSGGQYGQQVINGNCAGGQLSLAHEIGHNLGLHHNIGDMGANLPACGATAVGYGESRFRTVMSYPNPVIGGVTQSYGSRTPQYSAPPPAVWFSDHISAIGTTATNATNCLKSTVGTIAAFYTATGTPPPPPPPAPHTAPTAVAWTRTGAPGATVAGNLTWTHTRTVDLASYKYTVDGGAAVSLGLPATNTSVVTLDSGTRSLILSACYTDNTCPAAPALTIVVPSATTPLAYSGLTPADNATAAKGSTVTFSVTATDDSGILSVVGYFSNRSSYQTKSTTRNGNVYTFIVKRPTGTRLWYFVITANDGEIVQTPTRTLVVQ